jgi:hypothetical protein
MTCTLPHTDAPPSKAKPIANDSVALLGHPIFLGCFTVFPNSYLRTLPPVTENRQRQQLARRCTAIIANPQHSARK